MNLRPHVLASLVVVALAPVVGCNNDCDFKERCEGSVREICGEGPDQVVNRRVAEVPCEAPSEACVEIGDRTACVEPPPTRCERETFPAVCEDDVLRFCGGYPEGRFVEARDCALDGMTCVMADGNAGCR